MSVVHWFGGLRNWFYAMSTGTPDKASGASDVAKIGVSGVLRLVKEASDVEKNLAGEVPKDEFHEQLIEMRRVWGVQDDPEDES